MGRWSKFRHLTRALHLANYCNEKHISASEAIERLTSAQSKQSQNGISRREFLASSGKLAMLGVAGGLMGGVRSVLALPQPHVPDIDVGIVGAGLSGLSCGFELKRKGIKATLFEATADRVGGRCFSLNGFFPGQSAELGGEFIDTLHKTMLGYTQIFDLKLENVNKVPGEIFYYLNDELHPESTVVDEFRDLVDAMRDDLRAIGSPTADNHTPIEEDFDYLSLREYLLTRSAGPVISAAVDASYTVEYGREIDEISSIGFLLFIHADRRSKFVPFGVFSDERYHVVGGNQQIADGLRRELGGQFRFGMQLVRAQKTSAGRIQLTFRQGNRTISTIHDAVVLTIPFSVLRDVELHPSLNIPTYKTFAIENFVYGTNAKMMIGFRGRPWASLGGNGLSYSDSSLEHHQNTWESSPSTASNTRGVLTDYSGGIRGANLRPHKVHTEAKLFLRDLDRVFPGASALATRDERGKYLAYLEHWPSNPLALGSYTCNHPGYFTTIADNEAKSVDNLYFAGEHTNSFYEWQGFMEGACVSGVRAANEILQDLKVSRHPQWFEK